MKILHTSDWHVGKGIRGHSRADEHRAVLAEITDIAQEENVDLILVAGDFYETSAPSPESEKIVTDALVGLGQIAPVAAIAGNHDNARKFDAVAPLLSLAHITMRPFPVRPELGGRIEIETADGTPVAVAMLPFVSQRSIVKADELMTDAAFQNAITYEDRLRSLVDNLTADFDANHVNIVLAHAYVVGGVMGGGERQAHVVDEYSIPSTAFPVTANYVALGHLHRPQQVLGATTIHYSGSPLQLDFGETEQVKQVNIVDVEPGLPAKVRPAVLHSGRQLRTLVGTLAQLEGYVDEVGDDWLRVRVEEPNRSGLADEVRSLLGPGVVDIRVEQRETLASRRRRDGATPKELFVDYLSERGVEDPSLVKRFGELHEWALDPDQEATPTSLSTGKNP